MHCTKGSLFVICFIIEYIVLLVNRQFCKKYTNFCVAQTVQSRPKGNSGEFARFSVLCRRLAQNLPCSFCKTNWVCRLQEGIFQPHKRRSCILCQRGTQAKCKSVQVCLPTTICSKKKRSRMHPQATVGKTPFPPIILQQKRQKQAQNVQKHLPNLANWYIMILLEFWAPCCGVPATANKTTRR